MWISNNFGGWLTGARLDLDADRHGVVSKPHRNAQAGRANSRLDDRRAADCHAVRDVPSPAITLP